MEIHHKPVVTNLNIIHINHYLFKLISSISEENHIVHYV